MCGLINGTVIHAVAGGIVADLQQLAAEGVSADELPSAVEARRLYGQSMAWGLVIGWLMCPPNNYGRAIWSANVRRLVAACADLRTFEALGVC